MNYLFVLGFLFCTGSAFSSPVVQSGCEYNYPPFCFEDTDSTAAGFSVELMNAALTAMGQEVTWSPGTWSSVKELLETSTLDCLPLVGRTPEREPFFDFTFPYICTELLLFLKTAIPSGRFQTWKD